MPPSLPSSRKSALGCRAWGMTVACSAAIVYEDSHSLCCTFCVRLSFATLTVTAVSLGALSVS